MSFNIPHPWQKVITLAKLHNVRNRYLMRHRSLYKALYQMLGGLPSAKNWKWHVIFHVSGTFLNYQERISASPLLFYNIGGALNFTNSWYVTQNYITENMIGSPCEWKNFIYQLDFYKEKKIWRFDNRISIFFSVLKACPS